MPSNAEAAALLREIADLLDLTGERFKPEAYRRAARSVETLGEELAAVAGRGGLREVPGVGAAIEEKLGEYVATGRIDYLDRLRAEVPAGLVTLMRLPGIGPKTTRRFWTELGVTGPEELARAIEANRLAGLKGFGTRKIDQLTAALRVSAAGPPPGRQPIEAVYATAVGLRETLRTTAPTEQVEVAGSFRRGRETVGDLDLLVTSSDAEKVFDVFSALPEIAEVRMRGGTKETVLLKGGLQVDLRVVAPEAFGAALQYFTGSKEHNVRLRSLARDRGLKINEYGVFRGEERVGGRTEEEVYERLGLAWIPPELREDHGEIDAARDRRLPTLFEAGDLRGDLHVHLPPGDAAAALRAVRAEAEAIGLRYLGVVVAAPGPGDESVRLADEPRAAVRSAPEGRVRLLTAAEVTPATPPAEAEALGVDYRIVRPGPGSGGARPVLPEGFEARLVAHVRGDGPSGRPWLDVAARLGAALEVGPGPDRIDSSFARTARAMELRLAVATGVGAPDGATTRAVAVGFARRAGATKAEVANAADDPLGTARPKRGRRRPTGA